MWKPPRSRAILRSPEILRRWRNLSPNRVADRLAKLPIRHGSGEGGECAKLTGEMQVNCEWPSQARWRLRFLGHLVRQHGKLASIAWLPATCGDKERSHELRRQSQDLIFEVLFGPSNFGATWTCKSTYVQPP